MPNQVYKDLRLFIRIIKSNEVQKESCFFYAGLGQNKNPARISGFRSAELVAPVGRLNNRFVRYLIAFLKNAFIDVYTQLTTYFSLYTLELSEKRFMEPPLNNGRKQFCHVKIRAGSPVNTRKLFRLYESYYV